MTSILDTSPYPWGQPEADELHEELKVAFDDTTAAAVLAAAAGLDRYRLTINQAPAQFWIEVLDLAAPLGCTRALAQQALTRLPATAPLYKRLTRLLAEPLPADTATTPPCPPSGSGPAVPSRAKRVNAPPMTAPSYFQDRDEQTKRLANFLRAEDTRMVTVVGRGGVGKTAMVCRLLKGLETGELPDDLGQTLGEPAVDGIVYLSPSPRPRNWPKLFTDLCGLLPEQTAERLRGLYQDPGVSPADSMRELLEAFPAGRPVVVLLDNFETLLDPATREVADIDLYEALCALLSADAHAVKVVITTWIAPQRLLLHEPGVHRQISLDEGLPTPYAETLLRERDPDGTLGLQAASDEDLSLARERTRGYPKALEALAQILSTDRNTSLTELLDQTRQLPDNVVEELVGEAFTRLDPLSQQIMQALAIFRVPVPAEAIDHLLQPYESEINAAPVLARLVNMQFVRRKTVRDNSVRYDLHQVDRDFALGRISDSQPVDRDTEPPPFTRTALRRRGAVYFEQTRTPSETWKTLDDLFPQLAEFELRYQGGDYDGAARVLLAFDFDYLIPWGHYRYTMDLNARLLGHLTEPGIRAASLNNLGTCHRLLGEYDDAIKLHEQARTLYRENGDPHNEASALNNLGTCFYELGKIVRASDLCEQALILYRETDDRRGEVGCLKNLGNCYHDRGQIDRSIALHEQALDMARKIPDRRGEAKALGNLGICYGDLGQTDRAIDLHDQALTLSREIGYRYGEAMCLNSLGLCSADWGRWQEAVDHHLRAIEIADSIGSAQAKAEARRDLAQTRLWAGDLPAARETIDAARAHPYPTAQAAIALIDGVIHLRQGTPGAAEQAFRDAVDHADEQVQDNQYTALDTKALALTGLTLCGATDRTTDAVVAFRAARTLTAAAGITARIDRQLDSLAPADNAETLLHIRPAATGEQ